ncbi:AAA family ATPase [Nonomuraea thailandensis]
MRQAAAGAAIVGRDGERAELSAFLASAQGQALVLRGETGVGKSALLDHAATLAAPAHDVIRAAGVEAESELPYAGLHQLLYPCSPTCPGWMMGTAPPSTSPSGCARAGRRRSCPSASPFWTC